MHAIKNINTSYDRFYWTILHRRFLSTNQQYGNNWIGNFSLRDVGLAVIVNVQQTSCVYFTGYTAVCILYRYLLVIFFCGTHIRHPIFRPWGRVMAVFWIKDLTNVLTVVLYMLYRVSPDRDISRFDCKHMSFSSVSFSVRRVGLVYSIIPSLHWMTLCKR